MTQSGFVSSFTHQTPPSIHLAIQRHRMNPVGILRSSFRNPADGRSSNC